MEVQVEILIQTITAQYGTLNPGDTLRTNAEFAAHLVDDCGAAAYCKPPVQSHAAAAADVSLPDAVVACGSDVQTSAQDGAGASVATLPAVVTDSAAGSVADAQIAGASVEEVPAAKPKARAKKAVEVTDGQQ